jgi:hypothetical protein
MEKGMRRIYKPLSLALAVIFAAVGLTFLLLPGGVISFFSRLSETLGFRPAPPAGADFFLILAVGYMTVVTFLAWQMYRHPHEKTFPLILTVAKVASSVVSFAFFIVLAPYLIYLVNGLVDGLIGAVVLLLYFSLPTRDA